MNKNKENNFAKKRKYTLGCILAVLSIILITVFAISASAEDSTEVIAKEIEDEKTLVRTTASLSRGSNENGIVDKDTLAEQLNKYAGTGITTVSEKSSEILLVKFIKSGRQYEVEISTGNLFEEIYTITYDANGGTGAPEAQEKHHGLDITLSSIVPTRIGYGFLGWSTNSIDTSGMYSAGATFSENANTTLYAIWEANTYTITYNANGGSGAPEAQIKTHDVNLTLSSIEPTRSGHIFLGWSTSSSATSAMYSAGGTFIENADTTLYAIWEANTEVAVGDIVTYKDLTWTVTALTDGIVTMSATAPYGSCTLSGVEGETCSDQFTRLVSELDNYCNGNFGNTEKEITAIAATTSQGWTGTEYWISSEYKINSGCGADSWVTGLYIVTADGIDGVKLGDADSNEIIDVVVSETYPVWPILTLPLEIIEQASDGSRIIN